MIRMMQTGIEFPGPVNIGNLREFTMLELAEKVISLTKSSSRLNYVDLPAEDPKQRQPDVTLARRELNREPTVSLEDGLRETISYFRRTLNAD